MPKTTAQNPQQQLKTIINLGIDTATIAEIYHSQCESLFDAIQVLSSDPKHAATIARLCTIGTFLSDDAANQANCSLEAFEAFGKEVNQ